ncbi:aminopeptidase P N-terminal domain-containing protein [Janthinobacterium agaricidamnosum]|uniref:Xaa-Pro aminopeptidase n=1 Tax=Janthinobacterium agaricidamnosum NBRC 102515 = DSM 9628 TaxID=1349767 RepID=W0UZH9_9BURK|nr:aminopeptidase P N-terminal domain-containing protein [Janthinobacterium agaricidamnosum]CDG81031.1 aminopeptidase P, N-terminal domain protein [Janthinobacterium agaricidamnosum NBRC 102515 = DSM 9628]
MSPDILPYLERRARLMAHMAPGAVAVIPTAPEVQRNSDCDYPYRHDSYFYYLSGFNEPDSAIVLLAATAATPARSILFCRPKNTEREIWDGYRHGPEAARSAFGFDAAFNIEELDTEMARLLADAPALYYALGGSLDGQVKVWLQNVRRQVRSGISAPAAMYELNGLLDEMRLIKDHTEQAIMQRAADISSAAHARAMRATRPGMAEYAVEAELLYEFRRNGAQFPAYNSIVAAGPNACILHYNANNATIHDGDLVLIDAGCELDGYASDITRTYPANGRFTAPQKALYQLVLAAQQAALDAIKPGQPYQGIHDAALLVLAQGMLDLGLLDRAQTGGVQDVIANKHYLQFYMHGTGHWLGMDVHDVGAYRDTAAAGKPSRALRAGMVLTVEPGIYVRPAPGVPEQYWHIGIRIEDDVLVTEDGYRVLSSAPKSVAAIEQLMSGAAPA